MGTTKLSVIRHTAKERGAGAESHHDLCVGSWLRHVKSTAADLQEPGDKVELPPSQAKT